MRLFWIVGCLLVSMVWAQGPQGGGFGGGGGAGGFDAGNVENRQLFLTPGDRTEWTFEAKEDDAVLIKITSDVFDPAVAIEDEKGTKLMEIDDIEPGDQMAQLIFPVPTAGKYRAVVTNYKGTSGGRFRMETRRFRTRAVSLDDSTSFLTTDATDWVRVEIPTPGLHVLALRSTSYDLTEALASNGKQLAQDQTLSSSGNYRRTLFRFPTKGTYYFRVPRDRQSVRIAQVKVKTIKPGQALEGFLTQDEVVEWRVPAQAGSMVVVTLPGSSNGVRLDGVTIERNHDYLLVESRQQVSRYGLYMLKEGEASFRVGHDQGQTAQYQIQAAVTGKPIAGATVRSSLPWFTSDYWTFEVRPGDVVQMRAGSRIYHVTMRLFGTDGTNEIARTIDRTPEVALAKIFYRPGTYTVQIAGGGVGEYELHKRTIEPRPMKHGVMTGKLEGAPEVWRLTAKQGQDLAIKVVSDATVADVTVLNPDGSVHSSYGGERGVKDLVRIQVQTSGDYTVIVNGLNPSGGSYSLRLIDLT